MPTPEMEMGQQGVGGQALARRDREQDREAVAIGRMEDAGAPPRMERSRSPEAAE